MIVIKLTLEEYRMLTNPTRIEEWGAQQEIARSVQAQILALTGERATIDAFDIAAINKAIEINHEGAFIASATDRAAGWPTTEWETGVTGLKAAVKRAPVSAPGENAYHIEEETMGKYKAAKILKNGGKVFIRTNNGSCQCGDTVGTLSLSPRGDLLLKNSESGYEWQNFDGLARECEVGYGFGATAREVAALVEEGQDEAFPFSFSHGTYLYGGK